MMLNGKRCQSVVDFTMSSRSWIPWAVSTFQNDSIALRSADDTYALVSRCFSSSAFPGGGNRLTHEVSHELFDFNKFWRLV
jgi:hypothetical protein